MVYQIYRIDQFDCKRIALRFKDISKEKFLAHCKDKGFITYGGFETYIVQPGYKIEYFDGEKWSNLEESQWPAHYMNKEVFPLIRR